MTMNNIHATLVSFQHKGILLRGKSGSGKSDLALRLIMAHQAVLVADDRVNLWSENNKVFGSAPQEIAGKMEIRGVGIAQLPFLNQSEIFLCVDLVKDIKDIERLPLPEKVELEGRFIDRLRVYPFESSATCKIIAKISGIIS